MQGAATAAHKLRPMRVSCALSYAACPIKSPFAGIGGQGEFRWICYAEPLCNRLCGRGYEGSGGGEIRTHEAFRPSGFQDRRNQPLCHPSGVEISYPKDYTIEIVDIYSAGVLSENLLSSWSKTHLAQFLNSSVR